jgi:hypothetical protein
MGFIGLGMVLKGQYRLFGAKGSRFCGTDGSFGLFRLGRLREIL